MSGLVGRRLTTMRNHLRGDKMEILREIQGHIDLNQIFQL